MRFLQFIYKIYQWYTYIQDILNPSGKEKREKKKKNVINPPKLPDSYLAMLKFHNDYRRQHGLNELTLDYQYCIVAQEHAEWMYSKNKLTHKNFDNRIHKLNAKSENIAFVDSNAEKTFDVWVNSKGHKTNIVSVASIVGFGEKNGYWVAIFG